MKKYLVGKRISLHGLDADQLKGDYYDWMDDLSLDLFTTRSYFPNNMKRMFDYYEHACTNTNLILLGIFDNESGKHIGNITFQEIDWINQTAFIAYMLGDKDFTGKGIIPEACLMMMYYGFNKLNFERIWGGVVADHKASKRVCEKVGLQVEGCQKEHFKRNGKRYDSLLVGALREEWMFLYGKQAKELFQELPI